MKKILIVCALSEELKTIKERIKILNSSFKIDFLLSGVGNYNVIYNLKDYIDKIGKPDFIVNFGVCGIKDYESLDYFEFFNGIYYECLEFFQVYRIKNLSNMKETICPLYIKFLPLKPILSSEKVIVDESELLDEDFVDMESYGIDFVSSKENIPYIIIKNPFDKVSELSKNVDIKDLKESLKRFNYSGLFLEIENFFNKNENNNFENEINTLKEKYRLTFSETNFLKTYINKKISFGETFSNIFNELNILDKNKILENIKN